MKTRPMKRRAALLAACLLLGAPAARAEPELVLLVRHAERAAEPKQDPALSPAGQARARELAEALADAGVTAILTTQYQRTRQTAAPLAERRGIVPRTIEARRGSDHVGEVVAAVRAQSGVVLVVGHANTVPQIAAALAGSAGPLRDFCESSYAQLLAVQGGHLLRLRYGEPDSAAPQDNCQ
ncbi:SixA phosphatase family protein [Roseateles violae]|uniref:Histidine phosphatase family protein n=1 Tax=Roseateles violae TaxID=3058042 RepID=A0ABT8DS59_9BURK|nr:histidine phosphatase family protein [Pelomonas sp. PFR6]MDN3918976.1 histidine phosphatase family protein [Pelomonas sp. PFR6]